MDQTTGTDIERIAVNLALTIIIATGFFFLTTGLRRGAGRQRWWIRVPLVIVWLGTYLSLVTFIALIARESGIEDDLLFPVMAILFFAGTIALVFLVWSWGRAHRLEGRTEPRIAAAPTFSPISGDISPVPYPSGVAAVRSVGGSPATADVAVGVSLKRPSILRCAYDGFALPVRRPVLFVPFVFYMVVVVTLQNVFGVDVEPTEPFESPEQWGAIVRALVIALVSLPLFTLAVETTSRMAAEAETGRPVSLTTSLQIAFRRFPRALAVTILYPLGVAGGLLLLVIPGIIWLVRWILATQAVMLADTGIRQSFRVSAQITRGRWWQFLFLLLIIGLAKGGLDLALRLIPPAGTLVSGWLEFSWITVAMTLAYFRAGGPLQ